MTPQEALIYLAADPERRVNSTCDKWAEYRLSVSAGLQFRSRSGLNWATAHCLPLGYVYLPGPYVEPEKELPKEIEDACISTLQVRFARAILAEVDKRIAKAMEGK